MFFKSSLSCLSRTIENADIFNGSAHFTLKGKIMQTTTLGGIFSIALISFILLETVTEMISMTERRDVLLYQINEIESDTKGIELNKTNNFFLAVLITINDVNVNLTQSSPFNFPTTMNRYTRLPDGSRVKLKYPIFWAPCNQSDFEIYGPNTFSTLALSYAFCAVSINFTNPNDGSCPIDINSYPGCIGPPNFEIKGSYLSTEFELVQTNLIICNKNDKTLPYHMKCDTGNVTEKFKSQVFKLNLYYPVNMINPTNYLTPNKSLIDTVYWNLNPEIYKLADIFVDRITVQDFDSYFFTSTYNNHSFYTIQADKIRQMESVQTTSSKTLLQLNLRVSGYNLVYSRIYPKIQDFLTDLGGFSKTLMFLFAIVTAGYTRYKYFMILANELYDFKLPVSHKKSKNIEPPKSLNFSLEFSETKGLTCDNAMSPSSLESNRKANQEYFESKKLRKSLNYSERQYFQGLFDWCFCRNRIEEKLAQKGRDLALEELDIDRIVSKVKEVDRLKLICLNYEQRKAFDFMEVPLITLASKKPRHRDSVIALQTKQKRIKMSEELREIDVSEEETIDRRTMSWESFVSLPRYARLYVSYRNLKEDSGRSNRILNKKLIAMIDQNLMRMFKQFDQIIKDPYDFLQIEEVVKFAMRSPDDLTVISSS